MNAHRSLLPLLAFVAFAVAVTASAAAPLDLTWTIDGVQRRALVFPPAPTFAAAKAPVVFGFHGHGGTMQTARAMRFQELWPEAVVVYPQGLPTPSHVDPEGKHNGWQSEPGQVGDRDLKFFDAMLATLHQRFSVDDRRVYVTGFSNGAIFSLLLWAQRGRELAAIGVCAGVLRGGVTLTVPRPVIDIGGSRDTVAVFALQQETWQKERDVNGCSSTAQACGPACKLYASAKHAPVETIVHPGGHVYPPWASERIAAFFRAHPL
jgi:polyhydroxybutyrate depolymerase